MTLMDYTLAETQQLEDFLEVPVGELLAAIGRPASVLTLKAEWWGLARELEPDLTVAEARSRVGDMTLQGLIQARLDLVKELRERPDDGDDPAA